MDKNFVKLVKVLLKIFYLSIITLSTISKLWDIYLLL